LSSFAANEVAVTPGYCMMLCHWAGTLSQLGSRQARQYWG